MTKLIFEKDLNNFYHNKYNSKKQKITRFYKHLKLFYYPLKQCSSRKQSRGFTKVSRGIPKDYTFIVLFEKVYGVSLKYPEVYGVYYNIPSTSPLLLRVNFWLSELAFANFHLVYNRKGSKRVFYVHFLIYSYITFFLVIYFRIFMQ